MKSRQTHLLVANVGFLKWYFPIMHPPHTLVCKNSKNDDIANEDRNSRENTCENSFAFKHPAEILYHFRLQLWASGPTKTLTCISCILIHEFHALICGGLFQNCSGQFPIVMSVISVLFWLVYYLWTLNQTELSVDKIKFPLWWCSYFFNKINMNNKNNLLWIIKEK